MHILLTNDDGHEAPGIRALHHALNAHGHRVTMVAPSKEQSATSMCTTPHRSIALQQLDADSWHLDARPADTVLVALVHLLEDDPPDLVLSGINFGPNLGTGLHASGTIGAAVMALINGVPAIAVSAGMFFHEYNHSPRRFPSTHDVLDPAAEFTCTIIESLQTSTTQDQGLLPQGVLLNINYPPLPKNEIKGVFYPEVSNGRMIGLGYSRCKEAHDRTRLQPLQRDGARHSPLLSGRGSGTTSAGIRRRSCPPGRLHHHFHGQATLERTC